MAKGFTVLHALLVFIALTMAPSVGAFNVDIQRPLVIQPPGTKNSMFGFAVAQHVDQSKHWLLIGAPRAQTSQPDVVRGGAVFRCATDSASACNEIPFDKEGNGRYYDSKINRWVQSEQKSGQWFGATVKSAGDSGVIVACAPRYIYFSDTQDKQEPVGACYVAKASTTKFHKYAPCATGHWGFNRQGFCQAGTSAALSEGGKRLLIGAPGSWYWQGQLYNYQTDDAGKILSSTPEGQPIEDDTYMGYSSATGEFDGDSSDDYVVGIPKGDYYLGRIEMFTQNLTAIGAITGEQIGSYFGYSLAVADLNGDRMDDIIVGAPMYADLESTDAFDTGRVYIYYQISNITSSEKLQRYFVAQTRDTLDGQTTGARFGLALSSLGDINYDGYDDLCVGAPYAGEDKRGTIYIYHGSKKGIITEVSQIIQAKDIDTPLSAFGISISGGLDQDGNSYPDILVGAYTSDKAVFLRTKPVVRVYASLNVNPKDISLESEACYVPDNTRVPCLNLYTCVDYTGVGVPEEMVMDITWVLDAKDDNSSVQEHRAFFIGSVNSFTEKKTQRLQKKNTHCISLNAYVKKDPHDKLSPIKVTMEFKLNEETQRQVLPPILDAYIPTTTSFTAHILKDCGIDNICIPDLEVIVDRVPAEHKIGSFFPLEVTIIVYNRGEDSFNTNLWIDLPSGVTYNTISFQRSNVAISCESLSNNNTKVVCGLGNPMQKRSESTFTLVFTPTNAQNTQESLVFTIFANSTNPENSDTYENNFARFEIPVAIEEPDISISGSSYPSLVVLNTTEDRGEDRGRTVKHIFHLQNRPQGLTAAKETELQIKWPNYDKYGNPVLVIKKVVVEKGSGVCKTIIFTPNNASGYVGLGSLSTKVELGYEGVRRKRDTIGNTVACSERYCTIIQCLVGYLGPADSFVVEVESLLMVRSFILRREATEMYHITTVALAQVKSFPYDFVSSDVSRFGIKKAEVITTVNTDLHRPASKGVETWIIIVSVLGGLLVLLLLILLLWWLGFFKRKKPVEEGYFVVNGKSVDTAAD